MKIGQLPQMFLFNESQNGNDRGQGNDRNMTWWSVGAGLSAEQISALRTAVVDYQTALGRERIMDSTSQDTLANTATITGLFAYIMHFQAEITILVLITSLALNITRLYNVFKKKK